MIWIQASGSQAIPTHVDYSSEPKEEEMTLNKSSHVSCGSDGDGVKASLCYSYRHAGDLFSVWPSAVVKSKRNHEFEPGTGPGPRPFPLCPWYLCPSAIWIKTLPLPLSTDL